MRNEYKSTVKNRKGLNRPLKHPQRHMAAKPEVTLMLTYLPLDQVGLKVKQNLSC